MLKKPMDAETLRIHAELMRLYAAVEAAAEKAHPGIIKKIESLLEQFERLPRA